MKKCDGCRVEMQEAFEWQEKGYDVGFTWGETYELEGEHCFVFVLDKKGKIVVW